MICAIALEDQGSRSCRRGRGPSGHPGPSLTGDAPHRARARRPTKAPTMCETTPVMRSATSRNSTASDLSAPTAGPRRRARRRSRRTVPPCSRPRADPIWRTEEPVDPCLARPRPATTAAKSGPATNHRARGIQGSAAPPRNDCSAPALAMSRPQEAAQAAASTSIATRCEPHRHHLSACRTSSDGPAIASVAGASKRGSAAWSVITPSWRTRSARRIRLDEEMTSTVLDPRTVSMTVERDGDLLRVRGDYWSQEYVP